MEYNEQCGNKFVFPKTQSKRDWLKIKTKSPLLYSRKTSVVTINTKFTAEATLHLVTTMQHYESYNV